jgi:hypothetical protein
MNRFELARFHGVGDDGAAAGLHRARAGIEKGPGGARWILEIKFVVRDIWLSVRPSRQERIFPRTVAPLRRFS